MRMKSSRSRLLLPLLLLLLLLLLLICPAVLASGHTREIAASARPDTEVEVAPVAVAVAARPGNESAPRKHKHHLLLFMGGLKTLAAVVLIKIKIVLVVAAIVAVVVFTIKYLLGAAGLPDLPALLYHKANLMPIPPQHPPPPSYLPVVQEPVYGYGYPTPIPWEHTSHESYGNDWSKIGNGGRSLFDTENLYPSRGQILLKNSFNHKRRKRKDYFNSGDMYR